MRVIFMGTPEFAVPTLQKIISSSHHQVAAIFTQKPKAQNRGLLVSKSPVHEIGLQNQIPVYIPNTLKTKEVIELINTIQADIIVVVAYGFIIPKNILEATKYGCLNIHPSKLPQYRGAAPMQRTIINGEQKTAVCIMQMDEGLDTGDIILQEEINLPQNITLIELQKKCAEIGANLLLQTLDNIENLPRIPQNMEGVSYAHKLSKSEALVNWNDSAYKIDCKVRGQNPWPGVYFTYDNQNIKIIEAEFLNTPHDFLPSTVIDNELSVACGAGILKIKKLQKAGKNALSTADFLRGTTIKAGTILHNE